MSIKRPNWDVYFLEIAKVVATRSTCDRKAVGSVIVDINNRIISTGYNGAPAGTPHCDEAGHLLKNIDGRMSCIRTLHAESNAIDYAGYRALGGRLYTTVYPCYDCAKRIVNVGILHVYYIEFYRSRNSNLVKDFLDSSNVSLHCYKL